MLQSLVVLMFFQLLGRAPRPGHRAAAAQSGVWNALPSGMAAERLDVAR